MSTMKDFLSEAAFSVSIYQVFVTNLSRKSRKRAVSCQWLFITTFNFI